MAKGDNSPAIPNVIYGRQETLTEAPTEEPKQESKKTLAQLLEENPDLKREHGDMLAKAVQKRYKGAENYEKQYTTNYDPETAAGIDKFYTKQGKVLHPNGLSLAVDNIAKESPTFAELGAAENWALKFNPKNVKMGLIKSVVGATPTA